MEQRHKNTKEKKSVSSSDGVKRKVFIANQMPQNDNETSSLFVNTTKDVEMHRKGSVYELHAKCDTDDIVNSSKVVENFMMDFTYTPVLSRFAPATPNEPFTVGGFDNPSTSELSFYESVKDKLGFFSGARIPALCGFLFLSICEDENGRRHYVPRYIYGVTNKPQYKKMLKEYSVASCRAINRLMETAA